MAQLIFFRIAKLSEPVMSLDSRDTQNTAPEQLSLPNIYGAYEYIYKCMIFGVFFVWCNTVFLFRCEQDKCTLRLHSNAALGWHAVAITLEDFPASTTNFQSATPFSHVSLQFLVHVSSSSGPCNRAPVLIGQSPNDGSCEEVPDGDTFYSIIEAKHIDSSRR